MTRIRKAIFPVAGLGTRFLPATKAMPKEMLPVVDRPLIQHVVDEARQAGIEHFIFVTGRNKSVIEDHFDRQFELELTLTERGKKAELALLSEDLPEAGTVSFTRQQSPLGLGHAVWCARELVGHEPFALLLPDVLVQHPRGCLAQMIDAANELDANANIIAVEEVPAERVHMYGVVGVGAAQGQGLRDHQDGGEAEARAKRRPISPSPGATSCSRRSSRFWKSRRPAPAAKSSSPTPWWRWRARSRSTASNSKAAASTAAPRSDFSPPISPMAWRAPTSRRSCATSCAGCSAINSYSWNRSPSRKMLAV